MTDATDLLASHGGIRTELGDWFPLVEALGVPVPRTILVPVKGKELFAAYEGDITPAAQDIFDRVTRAADEIGYPAFIRSGDTSGEHDWKYTCHLDAAAHVPRSVMSIMEFQEMVGLPLIEHFAVRELLTTAPLFRAFADMPIARERRYFARDGAVYDHHPYWPAGAIEHHTTVEDWEARLRADSVEDEAEVGELTALTERVASVLPGAWSIDWLRTDRGWVFIDAAWAELSYVMPADERQRLQAAA